MRSRSSAFTYSTMPPEPSVIRLPPAPTLTLTMPSGGSFCADRLVLQRVAHVVDPDRQRRLAAVLAIAERCGNRRGPPRQRWHRRRRNRRTRHRDGRWSNRSCRPRPRGSAPWPRCRCRAARRRASSIPAGRRCVHRWRAGRDHAGVDRLAGPGGRLLAGAWLRACGLPCRWPGRGRSRPPRC